MTPKNEIDAFLQQTWHEEVWEYTERMKGEDSSLPLIDQDILIRFRRFFVEWIFYQMTKTVHWRAFAEHFKEYDKNIAKVFTDRIQMRPFSVWRWDLIKPNLLWVQFRVVWTWDTKNWMNFFGGCVLYQFCILWLFMEWHLMKNHFIEMCSLLSCWSPNCSWCFI